MEIKADCFKALGDDTRLKILRMLSDGKKCACDIQENFQLKQPTISHHMKILQQTGLVLVEKRGRWMFYGLNNERLQELQQFIDTELINNNQFDYILSDEDCDGTRKKQI
ncbi:ArsR/SmtB family transcription factor [Tindallia californiensis]|uniref:Transcriptional regulator, ArsR family n=1 Tax=Tindallia californiensis TaxID=159292 RepID=A0A1H3IWG1_9FIRM|nr:metalloregulator ArsR/SmtB family transcription factor [Tindallia californiensis]SDY32093.1 transcriptional regulator, ArsR family [Tindallia californiensis]